MLWKDHINSVGDTENTLYLPLFLWADDFEPLNGLGAHGGEYKICGVYIKIACLPEHLKSKIDFIFLSMLYFSEDRRRYGNTAVFTRLISELNSLFEEGIQVQHTRLANIKFITVLVLGDNLGVNSILGFREYFIANFWCRFGRSIKHVLHYQTKEDINHLRHEENYAIDVEKNYVSQTGIKERSKFNDLEKFSVGRLFNVDPMYDFLQGVCHYDLAACFYEFVYIPKIFSLCSLNARISKYIFESQVSNKPSQISEQMVKNKHLKYTVT